MTCQHFCRWKSLKWRLALLVIFSFLLATACVYATEWEGKRVDNEGIVRVMNAADQIPLPTACWL